MEEASNNDADVFVYMGEGGPVVPRNIVRVRVHPSVTMIHQYAFYQCNLLEEVELCDGLLEIGQYAFTYCRALKRLSIPSTVTRICHHAFHECKQLEELELFDGLQTIEQYAFYMCNLLKRLTIPNTVRSIGDPAFCHAYQLQYLQLPEGIESIGIHVFSHHKCPKCRIPPGFTTITRSVIGGSQSMFSVELSERVTDIKSSALYECHSLRNIAFPLNVQVEDTEKVFERCTVLQQLYDTQEEITNALKHRFDDLPVHKMIYYQSYDNITVDQLDNATNMRLRSKLDPSGSQRDCLGMTPLHIMACSTVQNLQLYRVLIEKYPETLVTEDRWGAVPLLYAVWGDAPSEIVQFLLESYHSFHPDYELNWEKMLVTLSGVNAQEVIKKLLDIKQQSYPEQSIDWNRVINELTNPNLNYYDTENFKVLRYLVKYSMVERIGALGPRKWREDMACSLDTSFSFFIRGNDFVNYSPTPTEWFNSICSKLGEYEKEYVSLKVGTSMIELTLWKNEINKRALDNRHSKKRAKIEETDLRKQCRVNCGANIIIEHVLPFLIG